MTLFNLVVRHAHWLARVPLLPQFFDAVLLTWTALWDRERLRAMELIEEAALEIPRVALCIHRFGGTGFAINGREFAHIHGNGLLDVFTGKTIARKLVAQGLAIPHHVFGDSAWASYWVRSAADVPDAIALLQTASGRANDSRTWDGSNLDATRGLDQG
ncbi:MAG: hypothetical protein JWL59_2683 [Chthoniobacteraceae bacterium]|nr:hypothetical protein [Chthoniobacteraceae bacterium]